MSNQNRKICWVTGASSGIGRALALLLGQEGDQVYISSRNGEALTTLAREAEGELIPLPCDVSSDNEMQLLFQPSQIPLLDVIYLCAGHCEYMDLPDLDVAMVRRVTETNYFGIVNSCAAALPLLTKASSAGHDRPHIVGVGSMSSYVGFPRAEAYGSSKAAMSYFLQSLRADLAGKVDVTVVYPGFIETPMTAKNDFPMPFLMSAEDAARILLEKSAKRPLSLAFPSRLHWLLGLMKTLPRLWYRTLVPRMNRQQDSRNNKKGTET